MLYDRTTLLIAAGIGLLLVPIAILTGSFGATFVAGALADSVAFVGTAKMRGHRLAGAKTSRDAQTDRANLLATLQLGVLVTMMETLALRDRRQARHAAAVARYSRAIARKMECDEADQEFAHLAGLLHDIGKFTLPDRVLHADVLSNEDLVLLRQHPQVGASLVGRLPGYGPIADAILYHHENVDGSGYPAGLIGREIPKLARIVAVASSYDHLLVAEDKHRNAPAEAIATLKRMAGRQLDVETVELFVTSLEEEGMDSEAAVFARRSDSETDPYSELDSELNRLLATASTLGG
ncbi:MAG TPA: HD domain-containing phosphohydrolase [Solirubrobacteraceae bacterium]|nr:HD domain-containing phosphohydrolase [Solirubrobacteraceae bacterium]